MNYNLLDEDWIPVLYRNGEYKRVGIRAAFEDAGRIRQIAASNPMDRVAILRFLLALLYWCKGNPPEDASASICDSFPSDWFSKLDENRDCFNLLGEGKRFYQNESYKELEAEHTTNYLIHEVPSGNNSWHFRHSTDGTNGLCRACCALGLVRLPVFATSGGKGLSPQTGKSPGINAKPPLYVLPHGSTLAATLLLSWRKSDSEFGTPAWEDPTVQLPKAGAVPLLTGMTWLPRSLWLGDPDDSESPCFSCGSRQSLIRLCVFDGKGSSKTEGRIWRDPHVLYATTPKGMVIPLTPSNALGASDAAAGQWSKIVEGILSAEGTKGEAKFLVVGFSTVQNDKYLEATANPLSIEISLERLPETLTRIDQWRKQTGGLDKRLAKSKAVRAKAVRAFAVAAVRPDVEHKVSVKTGELISGDDDAWEQAVAEYRPMMKLIAKSLSPGFTTEAVKGRREIASVAPDMRSKSGSPKNSSKKEGEGM